MDQENKKGFGSGEQKTLWISAAVLIILLIIAWFMVNNRDADSQAAQAAGAVTSSETAGTVELGVEDTVVGTGAEARQGQTVAVHYTGTLDDGTVFDSSYDRGAPFTFTIGAGQVIQGWELGITGMKEGGKRTLTIPPSLGYGEQAIGPIPANSTLHFDVELITIVDTKG